MSEMFYNVVSFHQEDLPHWNVVANVQVLDDMFFAARLFIQDVSSWNTSKVVTMKNRGTKLGFSQRTRIIRHHQRALGSLSASPCHKSKAISNHGLLNRQKTFPKGQDQTTVIVSDEKVFFSNLGPLTIDMS